MTEDYFNGLSIVPLDAGHAILSSIVVSAEHPWRDLYREREPPPDRASTLPCTDEPTWHYMHEKQLRGPPALVDNASSCQDASSENREEKRKVEPRETIRLCDVEEFRCSTAVKALAGTNQDDIDEISAGLVRLSASSSSTRPVIYRYIDVIKNSFALVEAIHFELFMPDRADLRFLAIPIAAVPSGTIEGDYFRVSDADLLATPSFAIKLGKVEYPVVWQIKQPERMMLYWPTQRRGLSYIFKKNGDPQSDEWEVISDVSERGTHVRKLPRFCDGDSRREHSIVRVTTREMASAHLHPVEPTIPKPTRPLKTVESPEKDFNGKDREAATPFDPRSEYYKRVQGVRTSSQRDDRVVCAIRALDATEAARIEDRLGAFLSYGEKGDLALMDELFRLGCRYRQVFLQSSRAVPSPFALMESGFP